jgi:hypothetical protein
MTATFETLRRMDAKLARRGHHPLTPFWLKQTERFYSQPTARTFVGRVGRGGAKSHTSAKVALNETLFGDWRVPPGERHYWAFVSKSKDEAAQRLLLLESFLRALGIGFDTKGDEIALRSSPRGFRVFACNIGAVSGFRCFGYSADELAKWNVEGVNPSAEVCASLNAMTITHPGARRLLISSPLGATDYHAESFDRGDTPNQVTAYAPSWVANPDGIAEAQTRAAEPNERVWRREYLAIPQAGISSVWTVDEVERAMRTLPASIIGPRAATYWCRPIVALDASSGKHDSAVFAPFHWGYPAVPDGAWLTKDLCDSKGQTITPNGEFVVDENGDRVVDPKFKGELAPFLHCWDMFALEGRFAEHVPFDQFAALVAERTEAWGSRVVVGDQHVAYALKPDLERRGLGFTEYPWTNPLKAKAVGRITQLLADGRIVLPRDEKLKREMLEFKVHLLPSGIEAWSGKADDRVSVLLMAALADINGLIRGSPIDSDKYGRNEGESLDEFALRTAA